MWLAKNSSALPSWFSKLHQQEWLPKFYSINDRYLLNLHVDIFISQYDHDCRHFRNAVAAKALAYVAPWKTTWDTIKIYKDL